MKELTALDLYYLLKEFKVLENSKVDQIYQSEKDLLIRLHSAQLGKQILRITKNFIFLSNFKEDQKLNPPAFCMTLRKYLKNARLRAIEQEGFERVLKLVFETRDKKFNLFIELFGKANVILTDEKNIIFSSITYEKAKRIIKKGEIYNIPKKEFNFLTIKETEFKSLIKNSDLSLVKTLATKLGLGGMYSEYVLTEYDKNMLALELKPKEISKLFKKLNELKNKDIVPSKLEKRLVPFETENKTKFKTFNEALANLLTSELVEDEENKRLKPYLKKKEKLDKIIQTQQDLISKLNKEIKDNAEKGELIYNKYQLISEILQQLEKAREKHSWKEIKDKLKNHKIVKEIDEKQSKVILEV